MENMGEQAEIGDIAQRMPFEILFGAEADAGHRRIVAARHMDGTVTPVDMSRSLR